MSDWGTIQADHRGLGVPRRPADGGVSHILYRFDGGIGGQPQEVSSRRGPFLTNLFRQPSFGNPLLATRVTAPSILESLNYLRPVDTPAHTTVSDLWAHTTCSLAREHKVGPGNY